METTIRLSGKLADLLGSDAQREGIPLDVLAARRLVESVLLWRIRTASPPRNTSSNRGIRYPRCSPRRLAQGTACQNGGEMVQALQKRLLYFINPDRNRKGIGQT